MQPKTILINILKFILFFGVGFGILYYVYQGQQKGYQAKCDYDFIQECIKSGKTEADCTLQTPVPGCSLAEKVINDFKTVNYFWIFIVLICFMVSNISRALRWEMLIRPLGYKVHFRNTFWTIMAGYFANLFLPRFGEIVRTGLFSRYEKIPLEKTLGTVVTDRVMDFICLFIVIGLAFLLEFDVLWNYVQGEMGKGEQGDSLFMNPIVLTVLGLGLLGVLLVFIFRKALMRTALFGKIKNILMGFKDGILTILKLDNPALFFLHTFIIWLMYYLMTYLCFYAFEPTATIEHATSLPVIGLSIFVFGTLGMVIPSPGGMGSYQYLVTAGLVIYGLSDDNAFSFSVIIFVAIQIFNILFGILAFILLPLLNKEKTA